MHPMTAVDAALEAAPHLLAQYRAGDPGAVYFVTEIALTHLRASFETMTYDEVRAVAQKRLDRLRDFPSPDVSEPVAEAVRRIAAVTPTSAAALDALHAHVEPMRREIDDAVANEQFDVYEQVVEAAERLNDMLARARLVLGTRDR